MKVKRFNNLWAMGLILCGVILVALFVARICCPEFIIGVAETPRIVEFGNYVDSHWWAYYLFTFATSYIGTYIYTCACCRKKYLSVRDNLILCGITIFQLLVYAFFPQIYTPMLYVCFILLPTIINIIDKNNDKMLNTIICFVLDVAFASFTVVIRDISLLVSYPNSATFTILLIDTWIWRALLYLYCNNKKGEKENG